jgi:hypothetical protein
MAERTAGKSNVNYPTLAQLARMGHPALMKASTSWDQFMRAIDRALPVYGKTMPLPLDYGEAMA